MSKHILFLCTGNYYRSRFAEILFNHLASEKKLKWRARSRGLRVGMHELPGPISPFTLARVEELKIDCDSIIKEPSQCKMTDLDTAGIVIALKESEHRPMLAKSFSPWETRARFWHVHDLDEATPAEALGEIEQLVKDLVVELSA